MILMRVRVMMLMITILAIVKKRRYTLSSELSARDLINLIPPACFCHNLTLMKMRTMLMMLMISQLDPLLSAWSSLFCRTLPRAGPV